MAGIYETVVARKGQWKRLKAAFATASDKGPIWFHCASLGEFEQGRPIIEALRAQQPKERILVTFFSPSGYNIRHNYKGADYVFYLPFDFPWNARRFLEIVRPRAAFFVKYEFWYFFLTGLKRRRIPTYLVSAIFRPQQPFFRWYGCFMFRPMLHCFQALFVQNQASVDLLATLGLPNPAKGNSPRVWLAGDTRFDRVCQITAEDHTPQDLLPFLQDKSAPLLVAGSTWPEDETNLARLMALHPQLRLVVAPHEIDASRIAQVRQTFQGIEKDRLLLIDKIGFLSSLYRYGTYCYIGGGFNPSGIHNTLEAATYGKPVLFGPNYAKFKEACDLIACKAAVSCSTADALLDALRHWSHQHDTYQEACTAAAAYVHNHAGATALILRETRFVC